ncbi:M23 family metallopeptidase [Sorangium sp. So ce1128]
MAPKITIEPKENNRLVFLRVARKSAAEPSPHMLAFRLRIDNKEPGSVEEHLQEIEVKITRAKLDQDNPAPVVEKFIRDVEIPANDSVDVYLSRVESIKLPPWPDFQAAIRVRFASGWVNVADPALKLLSPHKSPTPEASYQFPGSAADLGENEYFVSGSAHTGGDQHFAYDIGGVAWDPVKKEHVPTPGASGEENSHYAVMGKPVYAMADGEVVSFTNDEPGNPAPGKRLIQALGEAEDDGAVTTVSTAHLTSTRLATAVRTGAGKLEIRVWDALPEDKLITRRGLFTGETITTVALTGVSGSRLAAVLIAPDQTWKVVVFDVSANGMTVTEKGQGNVESGANAAIARISKSRIAVVSSLAGGQLRVSTWDLSPDGMTVKRVDLSQISGFPRLGICTVDANENDSSGRLVTAARTADNKLMLTTWDIEPNGAVLFRVNKDGGSSIDAALSSRRNTGQVVSAVRDGAGVLRVAVWKADAKGNLTQMAQGVSVEASAVSVAWLGGDYLATGAITAKGTLQILVWEYKAGPKTIGVVGEMAGGAAGLVALTPMQASPLLLGAAAVRTPAGVVKLHVFRTLGGGGNQFVLKHGDETVLYAHMVEGSLSPALCAVGAKVQKGQFLGNLGNSGRSSGPHLHIHAVETANSAYRPLPFHGAKAVRRSALPSPPQEPAFATVDDQGFYWEAMAIKPTW